MPVVKRCIAKIFGPKVITNAHKEQIGSINWRSDWAKANNRSYTWVVRHSRDTPADNKTKFLRNVENKRQKLLPNVKLENNYQIISWPAENLVNVGIDRISYVGTDFNLAFILSTISQISLKVWAEEPMSTRQVSVGLKITLKFTPWIMFVLDHPCITLMIYFEATSFLENKDILVKPGFYHFSNSKYFIMF